MVAQFQPAARRQAKARIALCGPSGSGKTYSALLIAKGLAGDGGRIAVVDTERGSAELYADLCAYDVCSLAGDYSPQRYIEALRAAEAAGYDVVVVDSLSHAWAGVGGVLDIVDAASAKGGGNKFAAWRVGTPQQNALVDALLQSPCHIIVTMRSKTEWAVEANERGKVAPRKIGTAPVQRDGIEYEFTLVFDLDIDHYAVASKDRTSQWDGKRGVLTAGDGEALRAWLRGGALGEATQPSQVVSQVASPPPRTLTPDEMRAKIGKLLMAMEGSKEAASAACYKLFGHASLRDIADDLLPGVLKQVEGLRTVCG